MAARCILLYFGRLVALLIFAGLASATQYSLVEHCQGGTFLSCFDFFTSDDPTHGFVDYVDPTDASDGGLIEVGTENVIIRSDSTNNISVSARGRRSVRLEAKNTYTHGLFVFSLSHMPFGCGTWPAFWTLGPNWPQSGEVDILEGVNTNDYNWATLHTGGNCTIAGINETGTLQTNNCDEKNGSTGCVVQDNRRVSYGSGLNRNGGGVYAMQWTSDFVRVWSFPHSDIPVSLKTSAPDPAVDFGKPMANFQGSCDIDKHFKDHHAVIDLTFCGDWAGNVFSDGDGCPVITKGDPMSSCINYVAHNPEAFKEAYWDINFLKVFQTASTSPSQSTTPTPKITHSVSPVASSRSITSQSVGMGASLPPKSSRLVPGSSVRPSSRRVTVSSLQSTSYKPTDATSSTHARLTTVLPPSGNTNRVVPTQSTTSHSRPACGYLFAPPPLPPTLSHSSSTPSASSIPTSTTTTLTHVPTSNPDALSPISFRIHCNAALSGLPITEVLLITIHETGTWGPDDAFVACMQKCASMSPRACAGVGFGNATAETSGSGTGDGPREKAGKAKCRIHGRTPAHAEVAATNGTRLNEGNVTLHGAANVTYHHRLSRRLGRIPLHERAKRADARTLTIEHLEGNFAAVRAPTAPVSTATSTPTSGSASGVYSIQTVPNPTSTTTPAGGSSEARVPGTGHVGSSGPSSTEVGSTKASVGEMGTTTETETTIDMTTVMATTTVLETTRWMDTLVATETDTQTLTRFVTVTAGVTGGCAG